MALALFLFAVMFCFHTFWEAGHATSISDSNDRANSQHNEAREFDEAPLLRIDLNHADWRELALLPGVGRVLAQRIVAHREQHGNFETMEDLDHVYGIGEKTIQRLSRLCEVHQDADRHKPRHRVARLP